MNYMKKIIAIILSLSAVFFLSCSNSSSDETAEKIATLESEIATLKAEIESLKAQMSGTDFSVSSDDIENAVEIEDVSEESSIATTAGEENAASDFLYAINDDGVTIRYYQGTSSVVVIPEEIEGYPVTRITEKAFKDNEIITSVSFPKTISYIGDWAFAYCRNLEEVIFPFERIDSLKIGDSAFCNDSIKNSLIINADTLSIGGNAFFQNSDIPEIALLTSNLELSQFPFDECNSVKTLFISREATVTATTYCYTGSGQTFNSMGGLIQAILPGNITYTTDGTYANSPMVTVYSEEGSRTLAGANEYGIPTNFAEYETIYSNFLNRYIDAGFIF